MRRLHRWLAIVLVVPLVVWTVTGLLFHLKPGWSRAYDQLSAERPLAPPLPTATSDALAAAAAAPIERLELFGTALGPLYRITTHDKTLLLDTALHARSPLSADDARTLALDAVAHSAHAADYGAPAATDVAPDTVRITFAHAEVDVDRATASISQHGRDTARIDWLYRLHYLSWTGNRTFDRILAVLGLALVWIVMIPGIVLFVRRANR
ncbi:MAG: PepSY domain-containing protein [Deltaproteobacteria bacterium]|nr:PepSY domain-containing protein [Deltaproteobacteria bacterium]